MSPTPELTDPARVEPLLTGAGHRLVARSVAVPPVAALRARSAHRRRRRLWTATAGLALVLGVLAGATVALTSSPSPEEVATASPDVGSSPSSAVPSTAAPTTAVPTTSAPPPTVAPTTTVPPATTAPTTAPTTAVPTTVPLVPLVGPTPAGDDVAITRVTDGAEVVTRAGQAAAAADLTFEHLGLVVWLDVEGDDLTASASNGQHFVEVTGSVEEILLYVLFAQFELPLGLDAPLEDLFEDQVLPELGDRLDGGEVPSGEELQGLLDGVMADLPPELDVAPSPRQLQGFLRDLYDDVPELDDLLGELPSRNELGDQLDRLGPLLLPLDRLPDDMADQLQQHMDEVRQLLEGIEGRAGRSLGALRDRLFGDPGQDEGGNSGPGGGGQDGGSIDDDGDGGGDDDD